VNLLVSRLVLAASIIAAPYANAAADTRWFTLSVDGVRTGFVRTERSAASDSVTESESVILFVRDLGRTTRLVRRIVFRHDSTGKPLDFDYELDSGIARETWHGTFERGGLHIHPSARHTTDIKLELPAETTFTPDPSVRFAALWKGQQTSLDVVAFDAQRRSAGLLSARVVADDETGRHVHVTAGSGEDVANEDVWFDAHGNLVRAEEPLFGTLVSWTPCEHDCDKDVDAPFDFMSRLVVRSPVQIPEWFRHRTLRFVLARTDDAPAAVASTGEQAVVFDARQAAVLTICANCGAAEHPTAAELARYLAPNAWVQSDNAEIRTLARNTVSPTVPVDLRMRKFVKLVKQIMQHGSKDFLGYGDAVGALHSGSGDCTEFSVLLAAFARSQGIPTRIAVGLAYSDRFSGKKDVFSPHVWVQSWNGQRWASYDAGLDGFDSTHIALAVGNGEPDEVNRTTAQLPLLRIEKAGVVRER
jgi:hypothetical protein